MELFSESKLEKWQQTISRDYYNSHQSNGWLFGGKEEYFNFIFGCVGEGIARAIAQKEKFDPEVGSFYLFCSLKAFEVLRDEFRKEYRRAKSGHQEVLKDLVLYGPRTLDPTKEADLRDQQRELLAHLSEDQRDVLLLVDYIGCPAKEAACILKRNVDAIYSLVKRARKRAKECLEEIEQKPTIRVRAAGGRERATRSPHKPRDGLEDAHHFTGVEVTRRARG